MDGLTAWVDCDRLWGLDAQKRLRSAKVCLLGMTGLGCEVIVTQDCGSAFILWRSGFILWRSGFILWRSGFILWRSGFILWRSGFILWRSGTRCYMAQSPRIADPFHFMEIRNWSYVAQSPRIADPLSFYPEMGLCGAVTQDCGSAFILWRSGTGAMWRSHPGLRIRFHFMEIRIHFMDIRNWGYVAQSPRIADLHLFNGILDSVVDTHWFSLRIRI
jgi:hypothetical protein